jgi:hypothetical protein
MEPYQRSDAGDVTALLRLWNAGDEQAFKRLVPLVYDELHRMALRYLAGERANISLQATALVNELWLRLLGWDQARWQNRGHFFGVSAQMMRGTPYDVSADGSRVYLLRRNDDPPPGEIHVIIGWRTLLD